MQAQTVQFAVTRKDGNITKIGRTSVLKPKTNFKGGTVAWYEDKPRERKG